MRHWPDRNREVLLAGWKRLSIAADFLGRHWKIIPPVVSMMLSVIIVLGFSAVAQRQHDSAFDQCERNNDSRVASIRDKRVEVKAWRKEQEAWEAVLALTGPEQSKTPPAILKTFNAYVHGLGQGIREKQEAIRESIDANAEVAINPKSPIVDCNLANP